MRSAVRLRERASENSVGTAPTLSREPDRPRGAARLRPGEVGDLIGGRVAGRLDAGDVEERQRVRDAVAQVARRRAAHLDASDGGDAEGAGMHLVRTEEAGGIAR